MNITFPVDGKDNERNDGGQRVPHDASGNEVFDYCLSSLMIRWRDHVLPTAPLLAKNARNGAPSLVREVVQETKCGPPARHGRL
jgi:hypothetical protein